MDIFFKDKKLQELAHDYKKCQKKLGAISAKRLVSRLDDLRSAETLKDVINLPGRFHPLKQNRKAQWACDLDHPYRLIFVPVRDKNSKSENNDDLEDITQVEIIEIIDYH